MLIFWKFSCLYGNGQKIQPARLISLFTFFYIPRTGNCSMGIFNNTSHLILFSYSLNINLILNSLKAKIICHNIKKWVFRRWQEGYHCHLWICLFFSGLFCLVLNLKLILGAVNKSAHLKCLQIHPWTLTWNISCLC